MSDFVVDVTDGSTFEVVFTAGSSFDVVMSNLQGPQGVAGATGRTGPVGSTGPTGINVLTSYTLSPVVTSTQTLYSTIGNYDIYQIDSSGGSFTINLSPASTKRIHYFVDVGGTLSAYPVTIATTGGDIIAGDTSVLMNIDYESINMAASPPNVWLII